MRRILFLLFAPFTLVGGLLVGYYGYVVRMEYTAMVAQGTPEAPVQVDWLTLAMNAHWLIWVGMAAVVLGGYVRHRTLRAFEKDIRAEKQAHDKDSQELTKVRAQLNVIRGLLRQLDEETKEGILNGEE